MFVSFRVNIYQDDVAAYLADAFPGNYIFTIISEETETVWAGNDDCGNTACFTVKFQIADITQPAAVFYVNDFFVAQV